MNMFKAWWEHLNGQTGWSASINKWELVVMQTLFVMTISVPVMAVIGWLFEGDANWLRALLLPATAVLPAFIILTAPFRRWREDQALIAGEQNSQAD